jgi:hypothetical protein
MDYNFNFQTEVWNGDFSYGTFSAKNWFSIGGPEHPIFKTLVLRIENEVPEIKNFRTYVNGGLLEDWMSWDIDMTITGEYQPELIKSIFEKVLSIAFDLHIWVDLRYQEVLWRPDLMTDDDYQHMGAWCYELHNYFSRDKKLTVLDFYEPIDGIYRRWNEYPFDKHIEKLKNDYIYQPPIELFK